MTWHHPALAKRTIGAMDDEIAALRDDVSRFAAALRAIATVEMTPQQARNSASVALSDRGYSLQEPSSAQQTGDRK